jgi:HNH endonuclease
MTEEEVAKEASARRGWPVKKAKAIVNAFLRTGKWGRVELFLGFRAEFKCEYCGLDLLSTVDAYKLWEKDHIERGAGDDPENLALACLVCNSKLKNRWTLSAGSAERSTRLKVVRNCL